MYSKNFKNPEFTSVSLHILVEQDGSEQEKPFQFYRYLPGMHMAKLKNAVESLHQRGAVSKFLEGLGEKIKKDPPYPSQKIIGLRMRKSLWRTDGGDLISAGVEPKQTWTIAEVRFAK